MSWHKTLNFCFYSFLFCVVLSVNRCGGVDAVCVRSGAGLRRGPQGGGEGEPEDESPLRRVPAAGGLRQARGPPAVLLRPLRLVHN